MCVLLLPPLRGAHTVVPMAPLPGLWCMADCSRLINIFISLFLSCPSRIKDILPITNLFGKIKAAYAAQINPSVSSCLAAWQSVGHSNLKLFFGMYGCEGKLSFQCDINTESFVHAKLVLYQSQL